MFFWSTKSLDKFFVSWILGIECISIVIFDTLQIFQSILFQVVHFGSKSLHLFNFCPIGNFQLCN
eukprot:00883.XXX_487_681_1 [CDS] Oithona nana genome sequencing.